MRRTVLLPVLVVALTALAPASPAAAQRTCADSYYRYTENGTAQYVQASGITTWRVSCRVARTVARRFGRTYRNAYGNDRRIGRYFCRWERLGTDVGITRCELRGRPSRHMRFAVYDSSPFH